MIIKNLIHSKKFICIVFLNFILLISFGFAFSNLIEKSYSGIRTWSNCDSTYIAFDNRKFDENCYAYYGDEIKVNLNEGDSVQIKTDVYQFLEDVHYDSKSILNQKNTVEGVYAPLVGNTTAIPISIANKYNLDVGDYLYLTGENKYQIEFIFNDVYDVKKPSINSDDSVIVIGSNTEFLNQKIYYAVFDTKSVVYNEVYLFKNAINGFVQSLSLYSGIQILLILSSEVIFYIFYRKQEKQNLYKIVISGSKKNYYKSLIGFNSYLYIFPGLLASFVLIIFGNYICSLINISIVFLISLTIILSLRLKIK